MEIDRRPAVVDRAGRQQEQGREAEGRGVDLVGTLAQHRVAANLLMVIMLLAGLISLQRMNLQIFPNFELDQITEDLQAEGVAKFAEPFDNLLATLEAKVTILSRPTTAGAASDS